MKYISKLFHPVISPPKNVIVKSREAISKSQRLLMENGVIKAAPGSGLFTFLPLGMRSLNKLTNLVESKMEKIGAQKISLPIFVPYNLWVKTGRIRDAGPELMKVVDRHSKCFILGPTHEESITDLIASVSPISHRQLPLMLYQIGNKYRDEMRPRFGVLRSREFLMKDLYTFDTDRDSSMKTYDLVNDAYNEIFSAIGLDFIKVEADTGSIGGVLSHEYHYLSEIGEDILLECNKCKHRVSKELLTNDHEKKSETEYSCKKCGNGSFNKHMGIELGHTFYLGSKYTNQLEATSIGNYPLSMGCYGLGLTRIIGAAVEILSTENELRWPTFLAPYTVCIIAPKEGSKEENAIGNQVEKLYSALIDCFPSLTDDVIIDDRNHLTIGKKAMYAKRLGYPFVIIVGKTACREIPEYEVFDVNKNESFTLNKEALIEKMREYLVDSYKKKTLNYMENFSIPNEELDENNLK